MDRIIKRFDGTLDRDLYTCPHRGVAYQANMQAGRVRYDGTYLAKVDGYAEGEIAKKVISGRIDFVRRFLPRDPVTGSLRVLDIGAGGGAFVRAAREAKIDAFAYEIIPAAKDRFVSAGIFSEVNDSFDGYTMWDSIEHIEDPELFFNPMRPGSLLFISVPVFRSLDSIRESKHYRPGEHLYYWTREGFIDWMEGWGFALIDESDHETGSGRDSIGAFAFSKTEPTYHSIIGQYSDMHAARFYGSSATGLYLPRVTQIVKALSPSSILDYGCGRSDLVSHFYLDGKREIARYDPAIPAFKSLPARKFDLVLCCDVMEHIPISAVDRVLLEIRSFSPRVFFTISTKLARAKLPNGRNAHITLLTRSEWRGWVLDVFGAAKELAPSYPEEVIILTGETPGVEGVKIRR